MLIIKLQVYIYFNFSQSTTIFLVYIIFIIYKTTTVLNVNFKYSPSQKAHYSIVLTNIK